MARLRNGYAQWVPVFTFFLLLLGCGGGGGSDSGTGTAVSPPAVPSTLQATAASSTTVNLTWTDNSNNEGGFIVYRGTNPSTVTTLVANNILPNSTGFSDTGLDPSIRYWYKVTAYNSAGESAASNVADATTQPTPVSAPAAPSTLVAAAASSSAINLTWVDHSNNEDGFQVYRGTTDTNVTNLVVTLAPGSTNYQHAGLADNTTYYYKVTAYNTSGNSDPSNVAYATTSPVVVVAPAAPSALVAAAASSSAINLTWVDNSNNEDSFRVYRGANPTTVTTPVATLAAGVTGFQDTFLAALTRYYYKVTAYNTGGESAASNVADATTQLPSPVAPAAPSSLQAAAASSSAINLTWVDNSNNEDGFIVYRGTTPTTVTTYVTSVNAGIQAYQDNTGLAPSTTYHYKVTAWNSAGESAASNIPNATTLGAPPAAPSGLVATAASSSAINLTWVDNSNNEDGFRVYSGTSSSTVTTLVATLGAGVTSYQNTGLTASSTYYYKVTSYNNSVGESAASNIANATTNGSSGAIKSFAAGTSHVLLVKTDGTLWAWGDNFSGQLGIGTTTDNSSPVRVGTGTNWAYVSAGENHTVAVKTDGTLWAWGNNDAGQLGIGSFGNNQSSPVQVGGDTNWASVSAGGNHTVARKTNGTLWAWGNNDAGQLGIGSTAGQDVPVQVGTDTTWVFVSAGGNHTVAVKTGGPLWAWGDNFSGQLGDGTMVNKLLPVRIGMDNWSSVSAGNAHTVARRTDGSIWGWGNNYLGQLGDGTFISRTSPGQIGTDTDWTSVSVGGNHSFGVKTGGSLWGWGTNFAGQLGDGTVGVKVVPGRVGTGITWVSVATGGNYTVAAMTDGTLWTWGTNNSGQLGVGLHGRKILPVRVGTDVWRDVSAGANFSAGVKTAGTLWTWGRNSDGQLGIGGADASKSSPVQVGSDSDWASVSTGTHHAIARMTNGELWAWGAGSNGELGNGSFSDYERTPVQIGSDSDWASVSTKVNHSVALKTNRSLWAWGSNADGQLGDNTVVNKDSPVRVGTDNWISVSAGNAHSVAVRADGSLWAWGNNSSGQLGTGNNDNSLRPVRIGTDTDWVSVSAGFFHSVARKTNGTLWAWGNNADGQLGDGTNDFSNSPVQVDGTWDNVSAGGYHTLARKADGTLWAWGDNSEGQLGNNTMVSSNSPVQVGTDTTWVSVYAGWDHTAARKTDGSIWAWGNNTAGQLGDGTGFINSPQQVNY